jgi:glycosyltransferase involved in cell wall biosynthesis
MKLLILYTKNREEIFNKKSALGSYINYLGNLLQKNGFEIYLNGQNVNEISNSKTKEVSFKKKKLFWLKKIIPSYVKRYIREKNHLRSTEVFKKELLQGSQKYDAILEYYNLGSDVGLALAKQQNIPYYIFYDGPILDEYEIFNQSKPFFYKLVVERQKESFEFAKKIVAQSNPMKDYVVKNIVNLPDKIFIHQNVDYTKFDILKEDKVFNSNPINIGFIGSFLPWHQVELLLYAFKYILTKGVHAKLFLIGDGMERIKMENIVRSFDDSIKSKIIFTGFVKEDELLNYKKIIDIGVMSGSNWYGAPLKIFEYGAMKMACIAPNTPTIKDLFPNNEVVFFEWKNQSDLNSVLLDFCTEITKMKKQSEKLHAFIVNKYSEQNTADFYLNFFN